MVKLLEIKCWTHHTRIKKALEEDLKVIFSKTMTYVLFFTSCLKPCYRQLIPFKWDENIWVYLAKNVLNTSDFCLAGGTYVEQTFTSCLIGVCAPLESLRHYTVFDDIEKKITYSDIYNWGPVVTIKDREMFSLKATNVPQLESVQLLSTVLKLSCVLSRCEDELHHHQ
ncbi:hypothetical protein HJG60_009254 [Phyllostomus discolor]|uniref:Uncharacterized protein n=1 Tax=Phyllostomus discolor TaxID=89673 RepID=A0A834DF68_9CHIR|nr:hypothetical protein HJG60_009254 [Phyllostomus discolor]